MFFSVDPSDLCASVQGEEDGLAPLLEVPRLHPVLISFLHGECDHIGGNVVRVRSGTIRYDSVRIDEEK